jgi:hypothetical protein
MVLNKRGSSRLIACPEFGKTATAEVGIVFFKKMLAFRQGQSSSPERIRVGSSIFFRSSARSYKEGRAAWIARIVLAEPLAEWARRFRTNSA